MDASQLTQIRRAVAVATGPRPAFGFTSSVDYTDAKLGRREILYNGAVVKPCCPEEEVLPLALTLTFEDEPTRSLGRGSSKLTQFIASRPQGTNFRDTIAAYKSFVPNDEGTTRAVAGGFWVFGFGRIDFADGSSVDFTEGYSSEFIPPGAVRIYGTIGGILIGGPSLTAVTFVPSTLLNIFEGFVLAESSVSSLNLNGLSTMAVCYIGTAPEIISGGNPNLTSVDFTPCTAIQYIDIEDNTALTSINVTNLPALTELNVYDNSLNSLDINGDVSLNSINCRGNLLTQTNANIIAASLVANGLSGGTYNVNPQSNGAIVITGGNYATLASRGWTIG